jgi:hypothetical protein
MEDKDNNVHVHHHQSATMVWWDACVHWLAAIIGRWGKALEVHNYYTIGGRKIV